MKRIAFVDKWMDGRTAESLAGKLRSEANKIIIDGLKGLYGVEIYCDMEKRKTQEKIIEDSKDSGSYHAVITHIMAYIPSQTEFRLLEFSGEVRQRDMEGHCCRINGASLDNIKSVHEQFPETRIIAYTYIPCSVLQDERLAEYGITHSLRRRLEEGSSVDARVNAKRDLERMMEWLDTEEISHLEKITEEQLTRALKNIKDMDFLQKTIWQAGKVGTLTQMMSEYAPKLGDHLVRQELTSIEQAMTSYFNALYPDFQKKFWKAVSVSVFVGQMVEVAAELFPHLKDDIRQWENTYGNDFIWRYSEWNKEEREWHPR